jgi:uncharacterized membrane protein YgaE (UPF0421/DUF939 family)
MVRLRAQLRAAVRHGHARYRSAFQPILLASIAAALSWLIAHRVLGHPEPFFAPIAAAIAISTSRIQRSRRTVQLVGGVLLGIAIGQVLATTIGTTTVALAVIVFITMSVAVLAGGGFVGEGMIFANQAAASAILVATLHRHGTGSERAVDAIVGGAVAFVLGVVMFPAEPRSMLEDAENSVLRVLARTLARTAIEGVGQPGEHEWALAASYEIHQRLARLARARSTARANVRVAPRRWGARGPVDAEIRRTAQLDLLANAVLGLVRAATEETEPLPEALDRQIAELSRALQRLAAADRPWPPEILEGVKAASTEAIAYAARLRGDRGATTTAILGATGADLVELIAPGR